MKQKKTKKYTVDIDISTDFVVYATSKADARAIAWEKFIGKTMGPRKLSKIVTPHFYHRED